MTAPARRLRRGAQDTFRSLGTRNFRLFFTGQLISQVGNWLSLVAQTLLVLRLTGSGVALGILAAAQFGPVLVFGAFAGLVADRSDKRKLLLIVQSLAMLQSFCLAGLAFMDEPPLAAILAVALAGGFAVAFDNPARRSFVVEMVPEVDVHNAVSLNSALMTGSRVIGPALAGALVSTVGFGWCFLLDGTSYLAVLFGLWRMDPTRLRRAPVAVRGRGQVRQGLRYARSVPELFVPLVMMTVVGTLAFNFQTVLPLFALRDLGGTDLTFTLLMSVISAGSLVGALSAARRRSVGVDTVSVTAIAFGLSMAVFALAPNQPLAFAVGLVMGVTSISFMTTSTALVQVKADPSMRGRVLALQAMVLFGSTPVGAPLLGWVSEHLGARYSLGIGAVGATGAGLFGLLAMRRGRIAHQPVPVTHDAPLLELAVAPVRLPEDEFDLIDRPAAARAS
ncbi:MAG: MFS transporter [Acidimicrobiales bacterium]